MDSICSMNPFSTPLNNLFSLMGIAQPPFLKVTHRIRHRIHASHCIRNKPACQLTGLFFGKIYGVSRPITHVAVGIGAP
jgi:hypothetical protein